MRVWSAGCAVGLWLVVAVGAANCGGSDHPAPGPSDGPRDVAARDARDVALSEVSPVDMVRPDTVDGGPPVDAEAVDTMPVLDSTTPDAPDTAGPEAPPPDQAPPVEVAPPPDQAPPVEVAPPPDLGAPDTVAPVDAPVDTTPPPSCSEPIVRVTNQGSALVGATLGAIAMSGDGRYVAHFIRRVADPPMLELRDLVAGSKTTLNQGLNVLDGPDQDNDGVLESGQPIAISDDGRFVALIGWWGRSVTPDYGEGAEVYVLDRVRGEREQISNQTNVGRFSPTMSADGRFVAYGTAGTTLRPVYLRDRMLGTTSQVNSTVTAVEPRISADGSTVVYRSEPSSWALGFDGTPGPKTGAFLYETGTLATTQIETDLGTWLKPARTPRLSGDGRLVAFSVLRSANPDDVVIHDRQGTTATLAPLSGRHAVAGFARDGSCLAFVTLDRLSADDENDSPDLYTFVRGTGTWHLVSRGLDGKASGGVQQGFDVALTSDCQRAAFISRASNLVAGDNNGLADVFLAPATCPTRPALPPVDAGPPDAGGGARVWRSFQMGSTSCGVDDTGAALCTGSRIFGQLGDGTTGSSANLLAPSRAAGNLTFTQVSTGDVHVCGLSSAGSIYCWGGNDQGQVGGADATCNAMACNTRPLMATGTFTMLTASRSHTCGLRANGSAVCWGLGKPNDSLSGPYQQIATGQNATCALAANGSILCWQHSTVPMGLCGSSDTCPARWPPPPTSSEVFRSVAVGLNQACGIDTQGIGWCWGGNSRGALGDGLGETYRTDPTKVAMPAGKLLAEISHGFVHACGRTTTGEIYCWGSNERGGLGQGIADTLAHPTPVLVPGLPPAVRLSASGLSSCIITAAGARWCWGYNDRGQLGDGTTTDRLSPVLIP